VHLSGAGGGSLQGFCGRILRGCNACNKGMSLNVSLEQCRAVCASRYSQCLQTGCFNSSVLGNRCFQR
jgi:hypothetical protein